MKLDVEIWCPDKDEYVPYAIVDGRAGVDRVEIAEVKSDACSIRLPPGYIIQSVVIGSDGGLLVNACTYGPNEHSEKGREGFEQRRAA